MNVLFITPSYPTKGNNYSNPFFKEQANAICNKHTVTTVSLELNLQSYRLLPHFTTKIINYDNMELHLLSISRSIPIYNTFNHIRIALSYINNLIIDNNFDIIHCQKSYIAGYIGYLVSKRNDIPFIITEHSSNFENYFNTIFHRKMVLKAISNASCIIAVGNNLKKEISLFCNTNIEVVPNVIETKKFEINNNKNRDVITFGFVGALIHRKGLDVLMKSLSLLKNKNYKLRIVGYGKLNKYKELSKKFNIEKKCEFVGALSPDKIPHFYKTIDIFILPSRKESFGVVLIEAIASGVPVISNPCGGPEDIIDDKVGLLYEYCNAEDLALKIELMINNIDKYIPSVLEKIAEQKYGKETFVIKLTDIYKNALNES